MPNVSNVPQKWRRLCVTAPFKKLPPEKMQAVCESLMQVLEEAAPDNDKHQITIAMALLAALCDGAGYSITVLLDALSKAQDKRNKEYLQ